MTDLRILRVDRIIRFLDSSLYGGHEVSAERWDDVHEALKEARLLQQELTQKDA